MEIEGVGGSTVSIRAERDAHALTDSAARDLLSHIVIREDVTPGRISIESERGSSVVIGAGYEVHYHVRAPKNAVVQATTTNGGVTADAVTGGITAHSTNGMVHVELAAIGAGAVDLGTTNGMLSLTLPADAKGDLDASVTNGVISVTGLKFEPSAQVASPRSGANQRRRNPYHLVDDQRRHPGRHSMNEDCATRYHRLKRELGVAGWLWTAAAPRRPDGDRRERHASRGGGVCGRKGGQRVVAGCRDCCGLRGAFCRCSTKSAASRLRSIADSSSSGATACRRDAGAWLFDRS